MATRTRNHWTQYWHQGNLTSLPRGFAGNYDGEFLEFWEAEFSQLAGDASVLDVCSGNGSIALLARDYSRRHGLDFSVKAADAAGIDTSRVIACHPHFRQHVEAIEFLPGTLLEDVCEKSESIDLVTSQYGVEYTDWRASAANIVRMLKPGGHFSMVCHGSSSRIAHEMELQQAAYSQLADLGLFSRTGTTERSPKKFARQLEQTLAQLYELYQRDRSSQLLSAVGNRLEAIRKLALQQFDAGQQEFLQFREGIRISQGIANDLLEVIRSLRQCPHWHEVFADAGLQLIRTGTIHYRSGDNAGASFQFKKPI